jgi:hypothetical protein
MNETGPRPIPPEYAEGFARDRIIRAFGDNYRRFFMPGNEEARSKLGSTTLVFVHFASEHPNRRVAWHNGTQRIEFPYGALDEEFKNTFRELRDETIPPIIQRPEENELPEELVYAIKQAFGPLGQKAMIVRTSYSLTEDRGIRRGIEHLRVSSSLRNGEVWFGQKWRNSTKPLPKEEVTVISAQKLLTAGN